MNGLSLIFIVLHIIFEENKVIFCTIDFGEHRIIL